MKTYKTIFLVLIFQFSIGQNLVEKSSFIIQPLYGVRFIDYFLVPTPFEGANVTLKNTNTIGLKFSYHPTNRLSLCFNVNYKKQEMRNKNEINTNEYAYFLTDAYYYSPTNGYAINSSIYFLIVGNFHIIQKQKFDWSVGFGAGYVYEDYKSNADQSKIDSIKGIEDDYTTYYYYPSRNQIPLAMKFHTSFYFALTERIGFNLELGFGNYNVAGGIYFKLR